MQTCISLRAADLRKDLNDDNSFLSLPTEVRHKIYHYLFCKRSGPLWLVSHYQLYQTLHAVAASRSDPIFETLLFRCCRKLHKDAITYAYSTNNFEIRGDLRAFCGLGSLALASIRKLSIVQGPTKIGGQEDRAWSLVQQQCTGLERLELVLQQEAFLAAVPFLDAFQDQARTQMKSSVALDVYVWDRHFSFDPLYRDLAWSEDVIQRSVDGAGAESMARSRILGLPRQAKHIVLTADVTAGAVQALDAYLASLAQKTFVKSTKAAPQNGLRAVGGRSIRFWYERNS